MGLASSLLGWLTWFRAMRGERRGQNPFLEVRALPWASWLLVLPPVPVRQSDNPVRQPLCSHTLLGSPASLGSLARPTAGKRMTLLGETETSSTPGRVFRRAETATEMPRGGKQHWTEMTAAASEVQPLQWLKSCPGICAFLRQMPGPALVPRQILSL